MIDKKKIEEDIGKMLSVQNDLNDATNGEGWIDGTNKHGKEIDWFRCIYMEAAEAIDSFPWKHWKSVDADVDIDNLKIELVDIWHFILSEELRQDTLSRSASCVTPTIFDIATSKLFHLFCQAENVSPFHDDVAKSVWSTKNAEEAISLFEEIIEEGIHRNIEGVVLPFFVVLGRVFEDWDEFSKLYYSKAVLNLFRQHNGYAEGKYKKNFGLGGVEDNVVMQGLLESGISDPTDLYAGLEAEYKQNL